MRSIQTQGLNPQQLQAVEFGEGPLLILAGAGSGKTRVITHRIAHLLEKRGVSPSSILAVTFTNKAAEEMRHRLQSLLGRETAKQLWIGTFHSLCLRMLRIETPYEFSIYDEDESKRLLKECQRELNLDEKMYKVDGLGFRIEGAKHEGVDAEEYTRLAVDFATRQTARVYELYQKKLARNQAVDFGDLILNTVKLFQAKPEVLSKYREKFRYILVDEYQDINHCQYLWIRQLAGETGNLTVVGDDDQSIYQFRGADLRNILEFERDYPLAQVVKLEQNYRSSQTILDAAHAVVEHNRGRKDKKLWTENPAGEPIYYFRGETEADEAAFVAGQISRDIHQGRRRASECVILYRTNAQSRPLEDALRRERLPYRIVGGMKFYDRMEIKDTLAYLKVLVNPSDEIALTRILNTPARGLADGTVSRIREIASVRGLTLLEVMELARQGQTDLPDRAAKAAGSFAALIQTLNAQRAVTDLPRFIAYLLVESGYQRMWETAPAAEGESRLENLSELIEAADEFARLDGNPTVEGFLQQIALASSWEDPNADQREQVTLMTLHSAKGLEFPLVFMVGMEEGLFPHSNALQDPSGLDEERRLCYVGITRAKERLVMTGAGTRSSFGNRIYNSESRFLHEIPARFFSGHKPLRHQTAQAAVERQGLWREAAPRVPEARPEAAPDRELTSEPVDDGGAEDPFFVGQKVRHERYGLGTIIGKRGEGLDQKVEIAFIQHGRKQMQVRWAALIPVTGEQIRR